MPQRLKDYLGGGLVFLLGIGTLVQSLHYSVGTLTQMGSGFFPAALGIILAAIGAAIALRAGAGAGLEPIGRPRPEWRGWICILLSIFAFALLGQYGGLLPATFASVFIAALGDRKNSPLNALLLAAAMAAVAAVIFRWGLQVQFPIFRWGGR